MRRLLIFLFISITVIVSAQDSVIDIRVSKPPQNKYPIVIDNVIGNKVFTVVEQMPQFPGGDEALMKFIEKTKNIQSMNTRIIFRGEFLSDL